MRADAERNRQRLIEVAREAFAADGPEVALEEIARRAEVGIGTLYRHFPTRDALLAEIYRNALRQLADAAPRLAADHPPLEALRAWMRLFVDYMVTKKVIAPALSISPSQSSLYAGSADAIRAAMNGLIERAVAVGEIRVTMDPLDLLRAIAGLATSDPSGGWREAAFTLIDVLIAGMRAS